MFSWFLLMVITPFGNEKEKRFETEKAKKQIVYILNCIMESFIFNNAMGLLSF